MANKFAVIEIQPGWVLEPEQLGTKEKFWYQGPDDRSRWLFKHPKKNTGQHWSEKIAAEVAKAIGIIHAKLEFAVFRGIRGSSTESFAEEGSELYHGNQILAGSVFGYNSLQRFKQSEHTLEHIFKALDATFPSDAQRRSARLNLSQYLVLDAIIGNTDRHHENWAILLEQNGDQRMAPTFDHASCLGRELEDERRNQVLRDRRIDKYIEKGRGAIYWVGTDRKGPSPLELVRKAKLKYADSFQPAIERVQKVSPQVIDDILNRMPEGWMSQPSKDFVRAFLGYTVDELLKLTQ